MAANAYKVEDEIAKLTDVPSVTGSANVVASGTGAASGLSSGQTLVLMVEGRPFTAVVSDVLAVQEAGRRLDQLAGRAAV